MLSNSDATARTVLGDVPVADLGHTQCHEHIWLRKGPSYRLHKALLMDDFDRSLRELLEYGQAGGRTIVDAQPGAFGRDADKLAALSENSGVSIIAVTGFHKLAFLETPAFVRHSESELAALFIREITEGMDDPDGRRSAARAGMLKCAYDTGAFDDPTYQKLFAAVAQAAAETGVPVMVHTEKGNDILGLIRYFAQRGVETGRLLICHLDRTAPDAAYIKQVLQTGCTLCMDSIHRLKYVSDAQETRLITELCGAGYVRQLVLSLDTTNERLRAYGAADMGLDYILTVYRGMLLKAGLTREQLADLCERNAQTLFSYAGGIS